MSWAEVQKIKETLTDLTNAVLHIDVGTDYARETVSLQKNAVQFLDIILNAYGVAEVSVPPKAQYELVFDTRTSNIFSVSIGEYKEVHWDMAAYDGNTVLPIDDVHVWLQCANLSTRYNYTDVADVVADTTCMGQLFNNVNANNYLMRSSNMFHTLLASEDARIELGNAQPARDIIAQTMSASVEVGELTEAARAQIFKHTNSFADTVSESTGDHTEILFTNGDSAYSTETFSYSDPLWMYDNSITTGMLREDGMSDQVHEYYYTFASPMIIKSVKYCPPRNVSNPTSPRITDPHYLAVVLKVERYDTNTGFWVPMVSERTNTEGTPTEVLCANNLVAATRYRLVVTGAPVRDGDYHYFLGTNEIEWHGVRLTT